MNEQDLMMRIAEITDTEEFYNKAKELGTFAARTARLEKTQISNLENIANSTMKISDIKDYIKRQTGRATAGNSWAALYEGRRFGEKIIEAIEEFGSRERDMVANRLRITDKNEKRKIYLRIVREFIRHFVIHYLYESRG